MLISIITQKAFCQEELLEEDAQTTITKQQQKKITKEAAKANKGAKGGKTIVKPATAPVTPAAVDEEEEDNATNSASKSGTKKTEKTKNTAPTAPVTPTSKSIDNFGDEEDKQPADLNKPNVVNGERVYIIPNKSTNPPTTELLDSVKQGNLNLYRPLVDTQWITKNNLRQSHDYKAGLDPYPAKPKTMLEIGFSIGNPYLSSDIQTSYKLGKTFAYGLTVRKDLGYVTSLRIQYNQGRTYGIGWKGYHAIKNNPALTGRYDAAVNYSTIAQTQPIYLNYMMNYKQLLGQIIINFNNIKFHKERTRFSLYGIVGAGPLFYNTRINQLDENGKMYDYSKIDVTSGNDHSVRLNRKNQLKSLWDETYESQAETDASWNHAGKQAKAGQYKWRLDGVFNAGLGIGVRLSRKISLNFETMQSFTGEDLVDGQRWQEHNLEDPVLTSNNDNLNYTSVSLNYNIGKKAAEPLWWLNPIDNQLVALSEAKNKLAKIPEFTDSDNDGVIDFLDREPNTPEGCPVDTHGVQLDSDKDGVPDCRDKEPFSVPGAKVDAEGVAEKKTNPEMDSLMAKVKDMIENAGNNGASKTFPGWYLPMIHFDLDKDYIKPDFYPDMFHLAQVMKMYPQMKVYIDGHTDIRHSNTYNEELSHRRAENAKNFLVKNYGIDPERLIVRYLGKSTNMVKDLPDHYDPRFEREQYINRRVEFTVVPESMQPQSSQQ
jgi:outer membrane protein OmpA-like peptidoglycan-associated protein